MKMQKYIALNVCVPVNMLKRLIQNNFIHKLNALIAALK